MYTKKHRPPLMIDSRLQCVSLRSFNIRHQAILSFLVNNYRPIIFIHRHDTKMILGNELQLTIMISTTFKLI